MGAIKRLMEDIYYLSEDGYTVSQISDKLHLPTSEVEIAISTYRETLEDEES